MTDESTENIEPQQQKIPRRQNDVLVVAMLHPSSSMSLNEYIDIEKSGEEDSSVGAEAVLKEKSGAGMGEEVEGKEC
jgi:hypothetical protein